MAISHTSSGRQAARIAVPAVLLGFIAILVIIPFIMIAYASLINVTPFSGNEDWSWTLDNFRALWLPEQVDAIVNTLVASVGGTAMAMVLGSGMAWLAARTDVPWKPFFHLAAIMPIFMSLLVATIAWSLLGSGSSGYINIILSSLGLPFQIDMESLAGITFLFGLYYAPFPYIFLYSALSLTNPELEEAALVHGADTQRVLRRVTFSIVKPALMGAMLLIFILMIEDFPVPQILGGPIGIETLSVRIYNLMSHAPAEPNQAAAVSVLLTAIVCVLVFTQRRVLGERDYRTVTGKGMQIRLIPLGRWRWVAAGSIVLYAFVAIGLPLFALLQGALRDNLYIPNAAALFDLSQMTTAHLVDAITDPAVLHGLKNSLTAGAATAVFGVALYFAFSYVVHRTNLRGRQLLEYGAMLPLALPSVVMGLGILWLWVQIPLPVYGTLVIIVIAFMTRFMPPGFRVISASISQIHDDLEEAALVSGASKLRAVWRIIVPLLRGGLVSTAFLMIVFGLRELTASIFLYTADTRVLSIVIFERMEDGVWSAVASMSLIYTALLVVLTLLGRRWMRAEL